MSVAAVMLAAVLTADGRPSTVDAKAVAQALAQSIIGPEVPLAEVRAFCESKIPPMPQPRSVGEWEQFAHSMREAVLTEVIFRGEARRWRDTPGRVQWLDTLPAGPGYVIKKLRYEAVPGLWIPALLYEPTSLKGRVPVVLNVNGHDGKGKAAPYKQIRCINQAKRGMLALNVEWVGMGQLRQPGFVHYRMNQLDLCGTSGIAVYYLAMSRALDVLLDHPHADPKRVAVAGLSGGGWQTIFISSLDPRVVLSNPVAGYSSFRTRVWYVSDLGDSEQTPSDLATVTDYAQLTALRAPRPTLLTFNASDQCCFRAGHALPPLLDAAVPIYELYGQRDALRYHINYDPGTHNFERDNREAFYRMLGDFFYPGDKQFDWREIPSEAEVKTAEELNVPLPADNRDFHALAVQLSRSLPVKPARGPSAQQPLADWQRDRRQVLRKLVRVTEADVRAERVKEEAMPGGRVVLWKLEVADTWTVPAVELIPDRPRSAALVFADSGRKATTEHVAALLHAGRRVVAIDPFYLGESKITQRDFLYALLVAAIGERPLGIQASQVAAIARWMAKDRDIGAVEVVAVGRRSSLAALVAAALEEKAIGHVTLWDGLLTLKEIIDRDLTVREAPELFCFGLLAQFDVPQLVALITPRTVRFSRTSPVASAPAGSSQKANPRSPRP